MKKSKIILISSIFGLLLIVFLSYISGFFSTAPRKGRGKVVADNKTTTIFADSIEVEGDICVFEEDGTSIPPGNITYKSKKRKFLVDFNFLDSCTSLAIGDTVCYQIKGNGKAKITFPKKGVCK